MYLDPLERAFIVAFAVDLLLWWWLLILISKMLSNVFCDRHVIKSSPSGTKDIPTRLHVNSCNVWKFGTVFTTNHCSSVTSGYKLPGIVLLLIWWVKKIQIYIRSNTRLILVKSNNKTKLNWISKHEDSIVAWLGSNTTE